MCTFSVTCWKEHWVQGQEAWVLAPRQPLTHSEKRITVRTVLIRYLLNQPLQQQL